MKKNPSLLIATFLVGATALSVGLSAPQRAASKKPVTSAKKSAAQKTAHKKTAQKKKKPSQHQQLQAARTAFLRSGNARPTTPEESIGTPAPVLPANVRYPQSSSKTAISTTQSSTVQVAAVAPTNTSTATATNVSPSGGVTKRFGGDITATLTTSTTEDTASDKSITSDLELAPWVQLSKTFRMDAYIAGTKDFRNERSWKMANSQLGLAHTPLAIYGNQLRYRAKVTLALPTDEDAREIASYRGGLSLSNRFLFSPKALPAFSGYYQATGGRNFYRYSTTGLGESNNAWSLGHTVLLNVDISNFYLQIVPRVTTRWTFEGTPSTRFDAIEEIGVAIGKWSIGLGHSNSDSLYKANGQDSNFSLFDRDTSTYYFTANLSF